MKKKESKVVRNTRMNYTTIYVNLKKMIISSKFPFQFVNCASLFISICISFRRAQSQTINCIAKWHYSISIHMVSFQSKRAFDRRGWIEIRMNRAYNQIIFGKIYMYLCFVHRFHFRFSSFFCNPVFPLISRFFISVMLCKGNRKCGKKDKFILITHCKDQNQTL